MFFLDIELFLKDYWNSMKVITEAFSILPLPSNEGKGGDSRGQKNVNAGQ